MSDRTDNNRSTACRPSKRARNITADQDSVALIVNQGNGVSNKDRLLAVEKPAATDAAATTTESFSPPSPSTSAKNTGSAATANVGGSPSGTSTPSRAAGTTAFDCAQKLLDNAIARKESAQNAKERVDNEYLEAMKQVNAARELLSKVEQTQDEAIVSDCDEDTTNNTTSKTNIGAFGGHIRSFSGHTRKVRCFAVFPENASRFLSGSWDNTIKLWDTDTGDCLHTFKGHNDDVNGLAVIDENRFISCADDGMLKLWNITTGKCDRTYTGHSCSVSTVAKIDERTFVSGAWGHAIKLWNINTGACVRTFEETGFARAVIIVDKHIILSGSSDKTIKMWDISNKKQTKCVRIFKGHTDIVTSVRCIDDNTFISACFDGTIKLWNMNTGECVHTFTGHTDFVRSIAVVGSPDDENKKFVSASDDKTIKLWDVKTLRCINTFQCDDISYCISSLGEKGFLYGSFDNTISLCNWRS